MKNLVIALVLLAGSTQAQAAEAPKAISVQVNAGELATLEALTVRINAERAKQFATYEAERNKFNAELEKKIADTNARRLGLTPVTAADFGQALLPIQGAAQVGLAPMTAAEVLMAIARPAIEAEAKAAADLVARRAAETAAAAAGLGPEACK